MRISAHRARRVPSLRSVARLEMKKSTVVLVGMRRVVVVVVVGATMVEGGCCVTAVLVIRCSVPLFTDKRGDDVTELSSLCISVCNNDRGVMTVARSDRRNDGVVAFSVAVESPKNKAFGFFFLFVLGCLLLFLLLRRNSSDIVLQSGAWARPQSPSLASSS